MVNDQAVRIAELERTLRAVEQERDELAADVERLCLQGGSGVFDPSYLLGERLRNAEAETRKLKHALSAAEAERDSVRESLQQLSYAKVALDGNLAELSERCTAMERDADFYKDQAAQAIAARDKEVEIAKAAALQSESRLREMTHAAEVAEAANRNLQSCIADLRSELASLREQQAERERRDLVQLAEAQKEVEQLRGTVKQLQDGSAELKEELATLRQQQLQQEHRQREAEVTAAAERERRDAAAAAAAAPGQPEVEKLRQAVQQLEEGCAKLKAQLAEEEAKSQHTGKLLRQAHKIEDQLNAQVKELQAALAVFKQQHGDGSGRQSSSGGSGAGGAAASWSPASHHSTALSAAASPSASRSGLRLSPRGSGGGAAAGADVAGRPEAAADSWEGGSGATPDAQRVSCDEAAGAAAVAGGVADAAAPQAAREPGPGPASVAGAGVGAGAAAGEVGLRVQELESLLAAAREELAAARGELERTQGERSQAAEAAARERSAQEDERAQLQALRTMVPDFKIKLAQATQEKVEALMRVAELQAALREAQRAATAAGAGGGGGGPGGAASGGGQAIQRMSSAASIRDRERGGDAAALGRSSKDFNLSRSPGSMSHGLMPAVSAPSPGAQPSAKSLWASWLTGAGGSWYGSGGAAAAPPPASAAAVSGGANGGSAASTCAPSVATTSESGSEPDGGGAATAAAAHAAAAAASLEAAEARNRLLSEQLERLRTQLTAVDRMAGRVAERLSQLRGCAALLWSERPEDAPRRWTALGELTRLTEACAALRAEAGLAAAGAAAAAPSPPPAAGAAAVEDSAALPPVVPLGAELEGVRQHLFHQQQRPPSGRGGGGGGGAAPPPAGPSGGKGGYDSSLVCTRESGGVQRRVAEALLGTLEFGVRSLEQYNHQSALSSVQLYG